MTTKVRGHAQNLETIVHAAKADCLVLMEVRVKATGETQAALCAANWNEETQEYEMVPFALMVDGNPYELLEPPDPDGGFYPADEEVS